MLAEASCGPQGGKGSEVPGRGACVWDRAPPHVRRPPPRTLCSRGHRCTTATDVRVRASMGDCSRKRSDRADLPPKWKKPHISTKQKSLMYLTARKNGRMPTVYFPSQATAVCRCRPEIAEEKMRGRWGDPRHGAPGRVHPQDRGRVHLPLPSPPDALLTGGRRPATAFLRATSGRVDRGVWATHSPRRSLVDFPPSALHLLRS